MSMTPRNLPRVDGVLAQPELRDHPASPTVKKRAVQQVLAERRAALRGDVREDMSEGTGELEDGAAGVARAVAASLTALLEPRPRRLLNCTGVLLHTNLGRAPLSRAAVAAMVAAAGSCELEFAVEEGRRGSRLTWLRPLLRLLLAPGEEDVHVVNNGAAALLLACAALGQPGGVVLSRGQMVEIGDGFRVAEMAAASGVRVHEVGSTNRTHVGDYAAALDAGASAILWVHLSNFRQEGFVAQPGLGELRTLADARGVPLVADLGSGSITGIGREPGVQEYLRAGAGLVTFSGDKLLGGPQAGLMVGEGGLVERCRRHPLARALRLDKTAVAALHATAAAHACEGGSPLHAMIAATVPVLGERAAAIARALGWPGERVRASEATIGGGSLPGDVLASVALAVPGKPERVARQLRVGSPGVVGRVQAGELLLDLRSLAAEDDDALVAALRSLTCP